MNLFGDAEKPSSKLKLSEKPKPKEKVALPEVQLSKFESPKPKEVKEEKKKDEREKRVFDIKTLPPLDEKLRLERFPNHPPKKPRRNEVKKKAVEVKSLKQEFKESFEKGIPEQQQLLVWQLYEKKGLTPYDAQQALKYLIYTGSYDDGRK